MNQTQRQFLIDKITKSVKDQIKELEDSKPKPPNLSNYLLHAVMSGNFEIISNEEIKALIVAKALKGKSGENWLGSRYAFGNNDAREIYFSLTDFFIIPPAYKELRNDYIEKVKAVDQQVYQLNIQLETLVTRIQLASNGTLQQVISEVDDMGNLSLFDSSMKRLLKAG